MTSGPEPSEAFTAVVLAAGLSQRFGSDKTLAVVDGSPMATLVVSAAVEAGADHVIVVVNNAAATVADVVRDVAPHKVIIAVNPASRKGQSTSLAVGLTTATGLPADVAVVLLADQPDVTPSAIAAVADAVNRKGDGAPVVARARHHDGASHPVAFHRRVWSRVAAQVSGDEGARRLLATLGVVDVHVAGPRPIDIDRPEDLGDRFANGTSGAAPEG